MQFEETQRLGNTGLNILYIVGSLPPFFIVGKTAYEAESEEVYNETLWALLFITIIFVGLYFLLFRASAKTRIDSVGLHYQYWPIIYSWRTIRWSEIEKIEVKTCDPLSDFGGWGYKFGRKKTGIILGGNQAIYITRANKKTFAITTQKPELARSAIAHWAPENIM